MSAYAAKADFDKSGHLSAFDPKRASPEAVGEIGCLLVRHGGWLALTATRNGSPTLGSSNKRRVLCRPLRGSACVSLRHHHSARRAKILLRLSPYSIGNIQQCD